MTRIHAGFLLILSAAALSLRAEQPTVHIQPSNLQGPRPLADQTRTAVLRDYLEAWQGMKDALDQNRATLLDPGFVGTARDKLGTTIEQQASLGLRTRYQDRAHDLQIVFYSPEGLSIQLIDTVDYDLQLFDHDKLQATRQIHARYIVVMTPTEVQWRVRVLQADPK